MVSNKEDKLMILHFLRAIRQQSGVVHPQWFMSDDVEQYYNAWTEVFGVGGTKKVLCAWHVDRAWRKSINQHIESQEKRIEIYHQLRMLLTERTDSQFRVMLQEFLTYIKLYYIDFYNYFSTYYCKRVEQWASCYRQHTEVNTNMFVEAFHRVLKIIYLHHKQNRRLDILFVTLLKIARNKAYSRLIKQEKGKNTNRTCEINRRHKSAEQLYSGKKCHIYTIEENTEWRVESQLQPNTTYTVKRHVESCECHVRCKPCGICTHTFTCTCLDYSALNYLQTYSSCHCGRGCR